jgi:glucan phosphoethanolaminetransferase (alkaline phosphatase superfamily)
MLFLIIYITLLWLLIIAGGVILVEVVAKIELDNVYIESIVKAGIAISMSILWIYIMVTIRDKYMEKIK